jgi:hypothetical protein
VAEHDFQARSGMDSPLTWTPAGVSALNAPARGAGMGAVASDTLERDGNSLEGAFGSRSRRGLTRGGASSPRARWSPARGSSDPRARRIPTRGGDRPMSEAGVYRGGAVPLERSGVLPEGGWADCVMGHGPAGSFHACV